jgi:hypothetical protein
MEEQSIQGNRNRNRGLETFIVLKRRLKGVIATAI